MLPALLPNPPVDPNPVEVLEPNKPPDGAGAGWPNSPPDGAGAGWPKELLPNAGAGGEINCLLLEKGQASCENLIFYTQNKNTKRDRA